MGKVILICGKICSGKSWYTRQLLRKIDAVVLSTDEILLGLSLRIEDSDTYDTVVSELQAYLRKKAEEIVACGANVIFDYGFFRKCERVEISNYFSERNIAIEWHYIDVSHEDWMKNIQERNKLVSENRARAYFVDEGLMQKVMARFEAPSREEMDVWIANERG